MSDQTFTYTFNILGNAGPVLSSVTTSVTGLTARLANTVNVFGSLGKGAIVFNQAQQAIQGVSSAVEGLFRGGVALDASLADLSAITGETGAGLRAIEGYARETAKTFGGTAAQGVEAYKLLLSQLSPELVKAPAALKSMGENVAVLSKTMGGDITAAAEVLTTAMNQYGVSLADPTRASQEMARMMNVMAAAGREGSAELPAIRVALEQAGMAAKAAGVSFEETNAAIQVLDKAGKKGSEGGVALRNVMATLARGRFLPKDVLDELGAAGVNLGSLTDKSRTLTERLRPLKVVLEDTALFTKLFGRENSSAAMALVQDIDEVGRLTGAIRGTNTAFEQAGIVMESYNERLSRARARIEDAKISLVNFAGTAGLWVQVIGESLVPVARLMPVLTALWGGMKAIVALNWAGAWTGITRACMIARVSLAFMTRELRAGQMASIGFLGNVTRATVGVARFATAGLFSAVKGAGAFVLSLVTGGAASATFAGVASASFAAFRLAAVSACRAVSIAIASVPIVGWVAAGIAALAALGVYFWNTSVTFRAVLHGLGAAFVATFEGIWEMAKSVFGSIGELIVAAFSLDGDGIREAVARLTGGFSGLGSAIGRAFNEAYEGEMARGKAEGAARDDAPGEEGAPGLVAGGDAGGGSIAAGLAGIGGAGDAVDRVKNVHVVIEKLVDRFEIHTTNLREDASRVKELVAEALAGAVNDVNYVM